jgi:hypothetical protein
MAVADSHSALGRGQLPFHAILFVVSRILCRFILLQNSPQADPKVNVLILSLNTVSLCSNTTF